MEVQPWASSGPILGKGAATGESTAKSPSAGVQPWAMETKVLRRKYSRGQWRPKPCSGSTAVCNGDPSPAAGVQSWAKEIKALRRKYRRGQWRRPKVLRSEHDRGQGFTAASEAPRWEYYCGHPLRVKQKGVHEVAWHGHAHATERLVVEEEQQRSDVCPFREKTHGRSLAMCPRDAYSTGGEGISLVE